MPDSHVELLDNQLDEGAGATVNACAPARARGRLALVMGTSHNEARCAPLVFWGSRCRRVGPVVSPQNRNGVTPAKKHAAQVTSAQED